MVDFVDILIINLKGLAANKLVQDPSDCLLSPILVKLMLKLPESKDESDDFKMFREDEN